MGTFFAPGGENVYAHLARDKSQIARYMLCGPTTFAPGGENPAVIIRSPWADRAGLGSSHMHATVRWLWARVVHRSSDDTGGGWT